MNISSNCTRMLSYQLSKLYEYACVYSWAAKFKMASSSAIVAEAMLEDKLADLCPGYSCRYDLMCPDFKNREFRNKSTQEIAEKPGKTCKFD